MKLSNASIPILLLVALMAALPGNAQVDYATATLKGTVFDPQSAAVVGASVLVTNTATGISKTERTTSEGTYQVLALNPGTYQIQVEAQGFQKAIARDVLLKVGQTVVFDVHMTLGMITQVVEVTNRPPLIETDQTQQANRVDVRQVENLPNVSRNFTQSIYTVPGVVYSYGPTIQDPSVGTGYLASGFSIGGSNGRNNLVTIDGGENDYGSGTLRASNVPIDSVQEFQINRNAFAAEFGYTIGSAMNVVTKGGTNHYHGSAYTYFHDEATDAVGYFNRLQDPTAKPFEQSSISGITFGGPIRKDKLFLFTSYEYQRLDADNIQNRLGQTEFAGVNPAFPGATSAQVAYLNGLSACGPPFCAPGAGAQAVIDLTANLNPLNTTTSAFASQARILNALLRPNDGTFDGIVNALGAVRGVPGFSTPRGRYNNWVTRLDYDPTSKDDFFLRFYLLAERDNVAPQPPASTSDHSRSYQVTGAWTHTFSPTLVNVIRVQAVPHDGRSNLSPLPNHSEIDLGNQIVLGNPFPFPYHAVQRRFQFDDNIFWTKGSHDLKFGISYRPDYYNVFEQLWFGGQWKFAGGVFPIIELAATSADQSAVFGYNLSLGQSNGIANPAPANLTASQSYLAGSPLSLLQANSNSNAAWKAWDHYLGFYAQDSWKASRKLTLNYGVRLDLGHAASPVPASIYVSPRLGIAWDPAGDGKTVIRAGGGIFVAPVLFLVPFYVNNLGDSGNFINWAVLPFIPPTGCVAGFPCILTQWASTQATATTSNPNPVPVFGSTVGPPGPNSFGSVFTTLGPNFKPEYSIQASLSIVREIAHNLSFEVGYNLYRSVHIEQSAEANFVRTSCGAAGTPDAYGQMVNSQGIDPFIGPCYAARPGTTAGEPNASILSNAAYSSVGSGIYHGVTFSLTKRYGSGLQFQANYTFSKAIDDTSDYSNLTTPYRPDLLKADRALSDFNVTHNFVANAVYNTPFKAGQGNFLSRILADVSVSPIVSARSGFPFTLFVPGLANTFPTGNGTFTESAHARPFNEGRNKGVGPGFISWDMRVTKAFYIRRDSGLRLDVIAQAQNLLNRNNFAAVNDNFPADPNFSLPNGGTLLNGPYNVKGFVPTSGGQLSAPLAFTQAYPPREVSVALRLAF